MANSVDGKSKARWVKIDFKPVVAKADCPAPWAEENGLVVIEMENNRLTEHWKQTTSVKDYTGSGYIQWTGNQ